MKKQQKTLSASDISIKVKNFPQCVNKKEARMVCLNEGCQQYAFFCLQCDDQSCQQIHRHQNHQDKFVAISFKEFIRRVLKEKKPTQEFASAVKTYRDTLERLKADINQFVERELKNMTQMMDRASQVSEDLLPMVKKLREEKYTGLMGREMDFLWRNSGESAQSLKMQAEMADFIRIKDEELKAISEHFENLNKLELDKFDPDDEKNKKGLQKSGKKSPILNQTTGETEKNVMVQDPKKKK